MVAPCGCDSLDSNCRRPVTVDVQTADVGTPGPGPFWWSAWHCRSCVGAIRQLARKPVVSVSTRWPVRRRNSWGSARDAEAAWERRAGKIA